MKIHEYQGKELLKRYGVTVPRGIACFSVDEAVAAANTLGGPVWVVKAQIHAGGRGKGGGVKLAKSVDEVRAFQAQHGAVVVKPIHGNGGKAIFRVPAEGDNLSALFEVFNQTWPEPHMVQPFLPEVAQGDKRIVLIDGEVAGAINRKPGEGEFRSNLAVGGSAEATELTAREQEICAAMGPELKRLGLIFVGIDVIGGQWLTEINVTSPTGIQAIDRFNGTDTPARIWDAIEARLAARQAG